MTEKKDALATEPSIVPAPLRRIVRIILRKISVGANVRLGDDVRIGRGAVVSAPHRLTIGSNVSIGPRSIVQVDGEIGDWVLIGMHVQIVGRNDHAIDEVGVPIRKATRVADRPAQPTDAVHIGNDVWIGASSVILSGVSIGSGSVIGAGSVVTRDVPEFSIAVGCPAHVIGMRFDTENDRLKHLASLDGLRDSVTGNN